MRKLFVLLTFLAVPCLFAQTTTYQRVNCRPEPSNPIPNTCHCDIKVKNQPGYTGFALFSCDELACEEFEPNQLPGGCDVGIRGVTCWVAQDPYYTCPLKMPRVASTAPVADICTQAVDDINSYGGASSFYNFLDRVTCTTAGASQPPFSGWAFTGLFEDGWN